MRPETGLLGEGPLSRRDAVAMLPVKLCQWALSAGISGALLKKRKLAPMLVIGSPEGPRVPIAKAACAQTRPFRSMRTKSMRDVARNAVTPLADRRPLKLPGRTVSFACFGHVPDG